MGIREWMIVIGILLLLAVLLDGLRRMRRERHDELSVAEKMNGGAKREDDDFALDDVDSPAKATMSKHKERIEPSVNDADATDYFDQPVEQEAGQAVSQGEGGDNARPKLQAKQQPQKSAVDSRPAAKSKSRPEPASPPQHKQKTAAKLKPEAAAQKPAVEQASGDEKPVKEIVIVNARATSELGFNGADLLQILLACDMRFGKHKIFHRHEHKNGTGAIQFSMANAVEPGVFDLNNIEEFHTSGVTFFLSLPGPEDPIKAFDYMVETANCLANNLGGELRDADKCSMTAQTLEHHRQRVQEFERLQLAHPD